MGETTTGVDTPDLLELQIDNIRNNVIGIVDELDHRRQDWGARLKHRTSMVALGGLVLVAGAVAAGVLLGRRRRHHRRLAGRARNLGRAVARVADDPDVLLRRPSMSARVLGAALAAVAATVAKQLTIRALAAPKAPRQLQAPSRVERAAARQASKQPWRALNP